jgi:peptidoglycan/xylan/chitin deacetylase (PgdA/CDA1 family)
MSDDPAPKLIGRRELLARGGVFVAGAVVVTGCATTRAAPGATPPTPPTSTTALGAAATTTAPTQPTSAAPPTTSATTPPSEVVVSTTQSGGPATYVSHGPTSANNVALTFHLGGDPSLVGELLDRMKTLGITSTLFAIGDWLSANPALGHRAVDEGHELGNHTKSHKSMLKLSRVEVRDEIVGGGQALIPFIGSIGKWFRPSGTDVPTDLILEEAGAAGYPVSVGYDIDSLDYTEPGADAVVSRVVGQLHPGAIVSLHFGHRDTIDALPQIVDALHSAGLVPVTVSGLLG